MLNKVEVSSAQGNLLSLPFEDIYEGLIVEDIKGLDPVKATLVSSGFAGSDGEQYQSSKREKRNIIIRLALEPDPGVETVEDLRFRVYDFFMPKAEVFLRFFKDSGLIVDIPGRVESCDTPLFTSEPAVDVSIICFDPDFQVPTPVTITTGTVATTVETPAPYPGTVPTGIKFVMNVTRTITDFSIYHRLPSGQIQQLDFSAPLVAGDVLEISTVTGNKYANLTHLGVTSSILRGVSPQSRWLELERGDNTFRIFDSGSAIPYSVQYVTRYGGL